MTAVPSTSRNCVASSAREMRPRRARPTSPPPRRGSTPSRPRRARCARAHPAPPRPDAAPADAPCRRAHLPVSSRRARSVDGRRGSKGSGRRRPTCRPASTAAPAPTSWCFVRDAVGPRPGEHRHGRRPRRRRVPREAAARGARRHPRRPRVTAAAWFAKWSARRAAVASAMAALDRQRLTDYAGARAGRWRSPTSGAAMWQVVRRLVAAKRLAPRTIRNVYAALRAFADAARDDVIVGSPCTLTTRRGELPGVEDKDPEWRAAPLLHARGARRVVLRPAPACSAGPSTRSFLTGRASGVAGFRWRSYDASATPLGGCSSRRSARRRRHQDAAPATGAPVHPVLAELLVEWRRAFAWRFYLRAPKPEDHIVPNRRTKRSLGRRKVWHNLQSDLEVLGLRARRARRPAGRWSRSAARTAPTPTRCASSHDAKGDQFDLYTSWSWAALCEAMSAIRIERPRTPGKVVRSPVGAVTVAVTVAHPCDLHFPSRSPRLVEHPPALPAVVPRRQGRGERRPVPPRDLALAKAAAEASGQGRTPRGT